MGQVIVRALDDAVIASLKARARRHGRSLEKELRQILTRAARPTPEEKLALADRIRALTKPGAHPLAEDLVRADRDSR
jgi:plasmid stability protein